MSWAGEFGVEGMCRGAWDLVGLGIECVCVWGLGEGQW